MIVNKPADTYLDTRELHKGMVWVGRQPLGRFWSIGPQYALYISGPVATFGQQYDHVLRPDGRPEQAPQNNGRADLRPYDINTRLKQEGYSWAFALRR